MLFKPRTEEAKVGSRQGWIREKRRSSHARRLVVRTGVAAGCMKARQRGNWTTLTGGWSQASRVLVVGVLEVIIVGVEMCTVLVPLEDWILGWGSNRQGSSWRVVGCSQGGK